MNRRSAACAGVLAILSQAVPGATSDRNEVAEIYAARVEIDQRKQVSRYLGNVEFSQGSVHITGDEVMLETPEGELQTLDIRGTPATYRELDDEGQELRATAEKILYDTAAQLITLEGDAQLCRSGEYFRSVYIEYNTLTQAVNAGKPDATEEERVRITLRPSNAQAPADCAEMP